MHSLLVALVLFSLSPIHNVTAIDPAPTDSTIDWSPLLLDKLPNIRTTANSHFEYHIPDEYFLNPLAYNNSTNDQGMLFRLDCDLPSWLRYLPSQQLFIGEVPPASKVLTELNASHIIDISLIVTNGFTVGDSIIGTRAHFKIIIVAPENDDEPNLLFPLIGQKIPPLRLYFSRPDERISYEFPIIPNTFRDVNNDVLTLTAHHAEAGKELPHWIRFDNFSSVFVITNVGIDDISKNRRDNIVYDLKLPSKENLGSDVVNLSLPIILVAENVFEETNSSPFILMIQLISVSARSSFVPIQLPYQEKVLLTAYVGEIFELDFGQSFDSSVQLETAQVYHALPNETGLSLMPSSSWLTLINSKLIGLPDEGDLGVLYVTLKADSKNSRGVFPFDHSRSSSWEGLGSSLLTLVVTVKQNVSVTINNAAVYDLGGNAISQEKLLNQQAIDAVLPSVAFRTKTIGNRAPYLFWSLPLSIWNFTHSNTSMIDCYAYGLLNEKIPKWLLMDITEQRNGSFVSFNGYPPPLARSFSIIVKAEARPTIAEPAFVIDNSSDNAIMLSFLAEGRSLPAFDSPEKTLYADSDRFFNYTIVPESVTTFDGQPANFEVIFGRSSWLSYASENQTVYGMAGNNKDEWFLIIARDSTRAYSIQRVVVITQVATPPMVSQAELDTTYISLLSMSLVLAVLVLISILLFLYGYYKFKKIRRQIDEETRQIDWMKSEQAGSKFYAAVENEDTYISEYCKFVFCCGWMRDPHVRFGRRSLDLGIAPPQMVYRGHTVRQTNFGRYADQNTASVNDANFVDIDLGQTPVHHINEPRRTVGFLERVPIGGEQERRSTACSGIMSAWDKFLSDQQKPVIVQAYVGKALHYVYPTKKLLDQLEKKRVFSGNYLPLIPSDQMKNWHSRLTNDQDNWTPAEISSTETFDLPNEKLYRDLSLRHSSCSHSTKRTSELIDSSSTFHSLRQSFTPNDQRQAIAISNDSLASSALSIQSSVMIDKGVWFSARQHPTSEPLPSWLHFNHRKCSFFGIPYIFDCGSWWIEVRAHSSEGDIESTSSELFLVEVLS